MAKSNLTKRKGEAIKKSPRKIIALFAPTKVEALLPELPNFQPLIHDPLAELSQELDALTKTIPEIQKLYRRIRNNGEDIWPIYTAIASIALLITTDSSNANDSPAPPRAENSNSILEENELSCQAWTWVQDRISWTEWKQLHKRVQQQLCVVSAPHPIETYAIHTVPFLSQQEVIQVVNALGLNSKFFANSKEHLTSASTMAMRLSHILKDGYPARNYGIIFQPIEEKEVNPVFDHACLPSAALELDSPARVSFIALYDTEGEDDQSEQNNVTICSLPLDGGGMEREANRRCAAKGSDPCPLCHCENNKPTTNLNWKSAVRLGHYYFQQGRHKDAKACYNQALQQNDKLDDIRHALGALELAKGKFVDAQLTWKDAATKMEVLGRKPTDHPRIALQLKKQQAYKYLTVTVPPSQPSPMLPCQSYFKDQCFRTPMLKESECRRLIEIANNHGNWTTGRHYAVPTNDIPVHDVPELLEWFYPWMEHECGPLVLEQFQIQPGERKRFYVHDAFVVRYEGGGERTNHLPCHLDECTHSFVLCLNKEFSGGGTYFHDYNVVLSPKVGELVSFKGDTLRHGGDTVVQGTRYILAAFLYLDSLTGTGQSKRVGDATNGKLTKAKMQKTGFSFGFDLQED